MAQHGKHLDAAIQQCDVTVSHCGGTADYSDKIVKHLDVTNQHCKDAKFSTVTESCALLMVWWSMVTTHCRIVTDCSTDAKTQQCEDIMWD